MFAPFEQYWIATDTYARLSKGAGDDDVLMINTHDPVLAEFGDPDAVPVSAGPGHRLRSGRDRGGRPSSPNT